MELDDISGGKAEILNLSVALAPLRSAGSINVEDFIRVA